MKIDKLMFSPKGWDDYSYWVSEDRRMIKKINTLIEDIKRNGALNGIGKPEPLTGDKSGWCSRRITLEHRLVYRITGDCLEVSACRTHYE